MQAAWHQQFLTAGPGFSVTELPVGAWADVPVGSAEATWREALLAEASEAAAGRLTFFDQRRVSLGDPIDWNRDAKSGIRGPIVFSPSIDYRDQRQVGDCKFVWEPNRHHHLVVLGRAYRATGKVEFADAVARQIEQWLSSCPFGLGMNWRSGLELGVRLINWVWALDLVRPSGRVREGLLHRILRSVELHVWEIRRKYSRGSSANNHLIGEAAGVYVAASYFHGLPDATRMRAEAMQILARETLRQTGDDGGTLEQALGYQIFVLGLLLSVATAAAATNDPLPPEFERRLVRMLEFLSELSPDGRPIAYYGDADEGYALDLNGRPRDVHTLAAWGSLVTEFESSEARFEASELSAWIPAAAKRGAAKSRTLAPQQRRSKHYPQAGYVVLRHQDPDSPFETALLLDCGELGLGAIAAHGHADALSIALRAFGEDVLVDPGTFDYFSYPDWRAYFRSTRAHNTLEVDGCDQSQMLGLFLWGARASARLVEWEPAGDGGRVAAEHDGYRRLSDPVIHRRTVELRGKAGRICVEDEVIAHKSHRIGLYFHVGSRCRAVRRDTHNVAIEAGRGTVELRFDPRLSVTLQQGSEQPISGWVSEGYHRKSPTITISGRCTIQGTVKLRTEILLSRGEWVRLDGRSAVSIASSAVSAT